MIKSSTEMNEKFLTIYFFLSSVFPFTLSLYVEYNGQIWEAFIEYPAQFCD